MYGEANTRLLTDKSLKKHRHVKIWWYVVLGLFIGVFCAQVYREVTREPAKPAVAASLESVIEDERRVGEDEEAVGAASRGGVKYDYVQNLTPAPQKENKVAAEGLKVPKVAGIKYAYVPKDGPIPTLTPQQNIPGIKYRYIPNDDSEKSVQQAEPSESDSDAFQMLESDVAKGKETHNEGGETMQLFADDSTEATVSSAHQKPVGEPMNDEISVENGAFKDLLDDVDSTQKQFQKNQPKEQRVQSQEETREKMRKEIEAQMDDDSDDLPDDEAYAIPADSLTHDDFNIVPQELSDDHEQSAASPMPPPNQASLRQSVADVPKLAAVQIPEETNLAAKRVEAGSAPQSAQTWGNMQQFPEAPGKAPEAQHPKSNWRNELLSDDFSDFHV